MTVTSAVSRNTYDGAGTLGPFAYTFRIFDYSQLLVTRLVVATGLETTLVYSSDFTATGVGVLAGGTITLYTALAVGEILSIRRVLPLTQETDLRNLGAYYPETVETGLDVGVMQSQQIEDEVERSVHLPEGIDPADFDTALPGNMLPGQTVVVNATGDGFSMGDIDDATLSAWNASQNMITDVFTSGFTPGVTTTLTLSANPGNVKNITLLMRVSGTVRVFEQDEYSVAGTTLTLSSAVPVGTTRIEVRYLYTYQVNVAASENVSYAPTTGAATNVRDRLRAIDAGFNQDYYAASYGVVPNTGANMATLFNAMTAAVAALGGGTINMAPGTYTFTADVTCPRTVQLRTHGTRATTFYCAAANKKFKITGGSNITYQTWVGAGIQFDGLSPTFGATNTDWGDGCKLKECEVKNSFIYIGFNCFLMAFEDVLIDTCVNGYYFDLATVVAGSGSAITIRGGGIFGYTGSGIYINGNTADGLQLLVDGTDIEHETGAGSACVRTVGVTGESVIHLRDINFELNQGVFVENDGAHIWVDNPRALSITEAAWFRAISGQIFLSGGRTSWNLNKFCDWQGGTVVVDPSSIFGEPRWWGSGSVDGAVAGSTAGSLVCSRFGYVSEQVQTAATLTDASPGPVTLTTVAQPFDNNDREWTFETESTAAVAAHNTLRIALSDGITQVNLDFNFPLFVGAAQVRITHRRGVGFYGSATYCGTAANLTAALTVVQSHTGDPWIVTQPRFFSAETVNGGAGTKASMSITNLREIVSGPRQTGL